MSRELDGKVAVVTGSTQGLGAGVARLFVEHGAKVALCGRSQKNGEALAAELGTNAVFCRADLDRPADCHAVVDAALKSFGGVDIVVNSAADTSRSDLAGFDVQHFDHMFALNVRAPLLIAQRALPSLRERRGTIINIGSVNAYGGAADLLVYSATKGALMAASRNLAGALCYDRVQVFCLNVGWMDTEGERAILRKAGMPGNFIEEKSKGWPMKRLLLPHDVAEACVFLASSKAAPFSGAVIDLEQFPVGMPNYPKWSD